jgi:alpha-ribazole phosphatase
MKLILVRHPQPLVAPGVCYGSTDLAIAPGSWSKRWPR